MTFQEQISVQLTRRAESALKFHLKERAQLLFHRYLFDYFVGLLSHHRVPGAHYACLYLSLGSTRYSASNNKLLRTARL